MLFFKEYKMHFPITDEYVDGVFREIDQNKDGKIQPDELKLYAKHFADILLPEYEKVLAKKWVGRVLLFLNLWIYNLSYF